LYQQTHVFDASRPAIVAHEASREYINKNGRRGDRRQEKGRKGEREKGIYVDAPTLVSYRLSLVSPSPFLPFSFIL
jgi:hypothetical protein